MHCANTLMADHDDGASVFNSCEALMALMVQVNLTLTRSIAFVVAYRSGVVINGDASVNSNDNTKSSVDNNVINPKSST